jgi:hypothetical protein
MAPLEAHALEYGDKPLCASLDGFTLHAATRAGALDMAGREALLRYVLRPPIGQERLERRPDGLVRITLKRAWADGTVAVDMDPLSLLCRLATSVPPRRHHTVKYSGVLASACRWRSRIAPPPPEPVEQNKPQDEPKPRRWGGYRFWAELLARTFAVDVLCCPTCGGRMKLLAMVTDPKSVTRYLAKIGEPTDVPSRSPNRGPPYWKARCCGGRRASTGSRPRQAGVPARHAVRRVGQRSHIKQPKPCAVRREILGKARGSLMFRGLARAGAKLRPRVESSHHV